LLRGERPFVEPIFWQFRNIWDIYIQDVRNQAYDSLTLNEWFAFIDELSGTHNFEEVEDMFEKAADLEHYDDKSEVYTTKSFVGEMVKKMNQKAATLRR